MCLAKCRVPKNTRPRHAVCCLKRAGKRRMASEHQERHRGNETPGVRQWKPSSWGPVLCAGAVAAFGATHLASVASDFRSVAGLHRWLMTYAEGFHRRGLVGTVFQALAGHEPREGQVALASAVSTAGTWLWIAAAFVLMVFAAARTRSRALLGVALAYAAFAFVNPMWTTRAYDNGYLDWLAGFAVLGALAAFSYRRYVLSGAVVAVGIVAYWGTVFVWLPLAFLAACLQARDLMHREARSPVLDRAIEARQGRRMFALLLPCAAALATALLHDNNAAVAELNRIGNQEHILRETFVELQDAMGRQADSLLQNWRAYLGIAAVYAVPPALCAALWTAVMRRFGRSLFQPAWLDTAVAVLATLTPLLFLLVAFDLSRLMAWTYFAFLVIAVFWLFEGSSGTESNVRPARVWPWTTVPVAFAAFFWTSPTIYAWADMGHLVPCERFCFKERTPQGDALDRFRRSAIASPVLEYTAAGGALQGTTGHIERGPDNRWHRIAREWRDEPGNVMDIDVRLDAHAEGVTVRARGQANNAIIGSGAHRVSISYRASGVDTANAETRLTIYNSTFRGTREIFRVPLDPSSTEFGVTLTPPADLYGNPFRWEVRYNGKGVFDLRRVSFVGQD